MSMIYTFHVNQLDRKPGTKLHFNLFVALMLLIRCISLAHVQDKRRGHGNPDCMVAEQNIWVSISLPTSAMGLVVAF